MPAPPATELPSEPASGPSDASSSSDGGRRGWFHRFDKETRQRIVEAPGPTWTEWFYHSFAKTYGVLGLFMGDAIVVAFWLEPPNLIGLFATLLPLLYLEFLLYQYLWYEPGTHLAGRSRSVRAEPTPRSWLRPVPFGRWSATGQRVRAGLGPETGAPEGPDPREFL